MRPGRDMLPFKNLSLGHVFPRFIICETPPLYCNVVTQFDAEVLRPGSLHQFNKIYDLNTLPVNAV